MNNAIKNIRQIYREWDFPKRQKWKGNSKKSGVQEMRFIVCPLRWVTHLEIIIPQNSDNLILQRVHHFLQPHKTLICLRDFPNFNFLKFRNIKKIYSQGTDSHLVQKQNMNIIWNTKPQYSMKLQFLMWTAVCKHEATKKSKKYTLYA